jgi:mycothiol synthase
MGARLAQVSINAAANAGMALLSQAGFQRVRRFIEMRLDFYNVHLTRVKEGPFVIRKLRFDESERLTEIQNRSFAGSWGFHPNSDEEIRYRLTLHGCGPEDVIMAYNDRRPVAYCWVRTLLQADGIRKGEIHMLGVDPDYRNQDIGREILLRGLLELKGRGLGRVDLTVDEGNHAARQLYESFGFKTHTATLWYEKEITR